jgi:hypothetical protein
MTDDIVVPVRRIAAGGLPRRLNRDTQETLVEQNGSYIFETCQRVNRRCNMMLWVLARVWTF